MQSGEGSAPREERGGMTVPELARPCVVARARSCVDTLVRSYETPLTAKPRGAFQKVPAMAYSPASSRTEYHRRCRA